MQNPLPYFNKSRTDYIRYLLLLVSVIIVLVVLPKKGKFKYEYEEGKLWMHDDLSAPFTFALLKTEPEIHSENLEITRNFKPYYDRSPQIENDQKEHFIKELNYEVGQNGKITPNLKKYYLSRGLTMLSNIYAKGIINLDTLHKNKPKDFIITEVKNAKAQDKPLSGFFQIADARNFVIENTSHDSILNKSWFVKPLLSALAVNITYNQHLSEKSMMELLGSVSTTRGMVKQDEKIISRGSIVTPERYRVLESLRKEYESNIGKSITIPLGYFIIIMILFLMFGINMELFNKDIARSPRSLILILINVLIFISLTSVIITEGLYNVYLIPYCIVPIVLLAFFGIRLAVLTFFLVIFICGLMVPNPYEFILLQTLAGFTAVLTLVRLRYISQFFISAMAIFFMYSMVYLGLSLTKTNSLQEIDWKGIQWFGGNFILILLAYPLVYVNERIFGFLSDIRLLELSDINNKILKELFLRAPGTFQHSIQVSNLVEAVMDKIGGNALLARVGALYHDIGKMYRPEFFTENQNAGSNPHDALAEQESAAIIIAHVSQGVSIAQKNHIPKKVIDFIRTHHGTTRVEYFYRNYKNTHNDIDETEFRYPGPKPQSKEMAVLMIVDSVEASARSLSNPDEKQIENIVDKTIDLKIQDNQFDYATITIQEINSVRRILKKLMKSIYHIRIQYPEETITK